MKNSIALSLILFVFAWVGVGPAMAQTPPQPGEIITLSEQMEKLLKVRLPDEREFLGRVIEAVQKLELSEELVLAVTYKARRYNDSFPFPYFRVMITKIAESKGIPLL